MNQSTNVVVPGVGEMSADAANKYGGGTPITSPTVVTNQNPINKIPDIATKAASYTGVDTSGKPTSNDTANYGDLYKNAAENVGLDITQDPYESEREMIKQYGRKMDSATEASIAAIESQYNTRENALRGEQYSTTEGMRNALMLGGADRYSPVSYQGILTSKERYDLKALNDLHSDEMSKVAQLRQAQAQNNYQTMSKLIESLDKTRQEKIGLAGKIADSMKEQTNYQRDLKQKNIDAVNNVALEAAKVGATSKQLDAIRTAKSPGEAIEAAAGVLSQGQWDIQKKTDAAGNESLIAVNKRDPRMSYVVSSGGNMVTDPSTFMGNHPPVQGGADVNPHTGLSFAQYGLLANTDFKPTNQIDQMAQKYLDLYIKSGSVPASSAIGRNVKAAAMAQIDSRARDLYFKATGSPLPNPEVIKSYQGILGKNIQMANNLKIQEDTVSKNVDLSIDNMKKNDLNSISFKPLNNFLNTVDDMFNDPATGQLLAQNSTIQNELGSLLAVKNASGTTVYDKMTSAGIITDSDTPEQIRTKVDSLLKEAVNFASSINHANADIYKKIDPLMQDENNPLRTEKMRSPDDKLTDYYSRNPDKRNQIGGAISAFKSKNGREPTAAELITIFPEIEQSIPTK